MRFPLIVLVIAAHSLTISNNIPSKECGWQAYYYITELLSHNLCKIAVCWFFVFSGYFFFYNLKEKSISREWVLGKWKKRGYSLLVPYILWNVIAISAILIKSHITSKLGLGEDEQMAWIRSWRVFDWLLYSTPDFPLWYMRDLMIMTLLAPISYYILRNKAAGLILIIAVYLLPVYPEIPGDRAICFFTLGAYLGIHKINLLQICHKFKLTSYIIAPILLILTTISTNTPYHNWLLRAFYPFGMVAAMNLIDRLIDNQRMKDTLFKMSSYVFFIYAAHEIYILQWTKGCLLRVFGNSLLGYSISYMLIPFLVTLICIFIYTLISKLAPRTLAVCCGKRI